MGRSWVFLFGCVLGLLVACSLPHAGGPWAKATTAAGPAARAPVAISSTAPVAADAPVLGVDAAGLHLDRNSLWMLVAGAGGIIAQTANGELLRFDADRLTLRDQRRYPGRVTTLASGPDGRVLAGTEDGGIFEVRGSDLALLPLWRVPGPVGFLGVRAGNYPEGLVAVARQDDEIVVHDRLTGRSRAPRPVYLTGSPGRFGSFFLDRNNYLWFGVGRGEWGGGCGFLVLDSDAQADGGCEHFASGFIELGDGSVLAYGQSPGLRKSFVRRALVDNKTALEGCERCVSFAIRDSALEAILPDGPEHVLLVFDDEVQRGPLSMDPLTTVTTLPLLPERTAPAREPHRPVITSALRLSPVRVLLATETTGLLLASPAGAEVRLLPGQFNVNATQMLPTPGRAVFFSERANTLQRLGPGGWEQLPLRPTWASARPRTPRESVTRKWTDRYQFRASLALLPTGELLAYFYTNSVPGPTELQRLRPGEAAMSLGVWRGESDHDAVLLVTPGGVIYRVTWRGHLHRFTGAGFQAGATPTEDVWVGDEADLRVVSARPPWLVHERPRWWRRRTVGSGRLFLLHEPAGQERLVALPAFGDAIRDAVALPSGDTVLVQHGRALRLRPDETSGTTTLTAEPLDGPSPAQLSHLVLDGRGRLWLFGDEVLVRDGAASRVVPAPELRGQSISMVDRDPEHPDGVVVTLTPGGAVFLRAVP